MRAVAFRSHRRPLCARLRHKPERKKIKKPDPALRGMTWTCPKEAKRMADEIKREIGASPTLGEIQQVFMNKSAELLAHGPPKVP